jgi:hypothetical protein
MGKGNTTIATQRRFTLVTLLLFALLLTPGVGWGQTLSQYSFTASAGTYTPLTSSYALLSAGTFDDGYYNSIPIGFTFRYCGVDYTTVSASTNGWMTLGQNITNSTTSNSLTSGGNRPVLAPLWDDLDVSSGGVRYSTTGVSPNRVFIVEWKNVKWFYNATAASVSFQVKLYEASGNIDFVYNQEGGGVSSSAGASLGITDGSTGSGHYLSVNGTGASPTVSSTAEVTTLNVKPASGQVYTFLHPQTYFSQASGDPNVFSSWKTAGGASPTNFTDANQTFIIQNSHRMTTTGVGWNITGAGSKIDVKYGGFLTANSPISIVASSTFQVEAGGTYDHNVADNSIWSGTETIDPASTITYGLAGSQNVAALTYGNLAINGSGTKTMQGNITINGNLSIGGSATLATDVYSITGSAAKTFTMAAGTGLTLGNTSSATNVLFPSNYTAANITLDNASTITYQAGGAQTVSSVEPYGNLTIAGSGVKAIAGATTINGNLSIAGTATLAAGTNSITGSAAGTFTMAANTGLTLGTTGSATAVAFPSTFTAANITLDPASTVTYQTGGAQTISSVPTYGNITVDGGSSKSLAGPTRVNGTLTLTNGKVLLGANDLTISKGASVSGTFSAANMVDVGGTGTLIKEGNANPDFVITYPIGIGAAYTPMQISSLAVSTIAAGSWIKVSSAATTAPTVPGTNPIARYWTTSTSGFSGSVLGDVQFTYFPADVSGGASCDMIYKTAGVWSYPGGASASGVNPMRATAATSLDATWTATVPDKKIFYSLKSGSWDDPTTWTLDPSGTQPLNPNGVTPTTSLTAPFDEVVILSGRAVTVPTNVKQNKRLSVIGTLDLGTTTGHSFSTVQGTGRIRLAGDNFPAGDATDFISAGQGQGTVEYYGTTRSITTPRTFYSVEVNMAAGNMLSLVANYTINGNFTVSNGTFNINDNSSTTALAITVKGDVVVASTGKIATGTANARHQLNLYGNFTNSGDVRFTSRTVANYAAEATDGIVDVNFLNDTANQSVLCKGITNFYRIEIDKGTDNTYTLNLDATAPANFNLFGFANEDHGALAQLANNNNALGLVTGTVRIGNSIVIPTLSTANTYNISKSAQLWINGGTVQKNVGQTISVYGKIKVTTGLLEAKTQKGISFCNNGSLNVDGGTVNTNQIWTSDLSGGPHYGAFVQSGGAVNVLGNSTYTNNYVFSLSNTGSVFNMSGGTLKVNTSTGNGAILINSDPTNINVTGGTVVGETTSADDFIITSRAPFWNLEFRNSAGAARLFKLAPSVNPVAVAAQPLKVLNDFRIWGQDSGGAAYPAVTFDATTPALNDVYIGGSFFIEKGAKYVAVTGGTYPYDAIATQPTARNTTYFNKTAGTSAVEQLFCGETANQLELGALVVDRTAGYTMQVTSAAGRANESVAVDVNGSASVLSGILDQNLFTVRTWGAIVNNDRMGTWYPGVTPSHAQIQIVENPSLTLNTTANAVFGNIQINVTPPSKLTLTSNTYIERMEYVKGLIYLKGYTLKVDNMWNMENGLFENSAANSYLKIADVGYSANSMIFTDGKASDGGLSLKVTANSQAENQPNMVNNVGPMTFPVGFTSDGGTTLYFRPAQMVVKNYTGAGYVTIRPVFGSLQTTAQAGGEVLQHYWRVSQSGFAALSTVAYRFYYRNQKGVSNVDLISGATNEATYVPGKVLDESPYTRTFDPLTDNDIVKNFGAGNNSRFITINGSSTNGLFIPASTGITLENANYTAGVQNRFTGSVTMYYTRDYQQQAMWHDANAWTNSNILNPAYAPHDSRQPASASIPGAGDVAVIGWIPWTDTNRPGIQGQPHGVWISSETMSVAEVVFTKMTDAGGNPVARVYRSNFQFRPTLCIDQPSGQLVAKLVKGEGLFWNRQSDPDYTKMDIGDFARQDSSYVIYENFSNNRHIVNTPPLFPNLYISNDNWGANDEDFTFDNNLATTGNIELLGNVNLLLPTGATGDITVGRNLIMFDSGMTNGGAEIGYGNTGTPRKIIIKGDLLIKTNNSKINVRTPDAGSPVEHELHVCGNIVQGTATLSPTGLNLWSGVNNDRITLYLDGANSMTYTLNNGSVPNLYRLVVNKGTSTATTAQFNNDYILNGPTSGVGVAKALSLQNGTFISNNPNAGRNLVLSSGNDYFKIPSTAGLDIRKGTASVSGTSGIGLDGALAVSGGTLDMVTGGAENSIEYSASDNAAITVSAGTLNIGGQIRRSLTSDAGILNYNQSGGSVVVGQNSASANNRGVFEILNTGSSFNMSAGDLYIARSQPAPTIASFYFNPDTYSIGAAANIHIGHTSTPASQTMGVYAGKPLPKLRVNNQSGNNPTALLTVDPATITSLLTIDAGAKFDAGGLDLTLNGDFTCLGTFIPNSNTTHFSGSGTQTITGNGSTINFYNFDKTASNNLILNGGTTPVTVSNVLSLRAGTFTTSSNTVTALGDVQNDATQVQGAAGDGILLKGTVNQTLTGNGTFGKLTINNLNGVDVPVANQFKITNSLKMQSGVFNIGKNLLDLGVNALIEQASPFSTTNMITTNISFTDNGVRKFFPAGAQPNFIFPVGSTNKYTPVTLAITANGSATGSITVKPANEIHPSIIEDVETTTQIVDKNNALQYYWTLKANGITGFSGSAQMKYIASDVKVTAPYTVADYFTAKLQSDGLGNWLKFSKADFDEVSQNMNYTYNNKGDNEISGDYTAGAGDNTLNGAIPDQVSKYITNSSGNWNTGTIWTPNVAGGPSGAIARIDTPHTVDVTSNNITGYLTEIYGTLKLYSTYGHRLGIVNGTGTLYTELGDIPAAVYDNFFSSAGGTMEFGGTALDYEFLGTIMQVNNLTISGSGQRRFPNNSIVLNGDLNIAGTAGLNLINYYNQRLSVAGNIIRTNGIFNAGTGPNATISLIGTLPQTITGTFKDGNAFNNLEINNGNDATINNDVQIGGVLKLTNGLINVPSGTLFKLNHTASITPALGSAGSFVNGTLTKEMMTGNSFTFPVGSNTGTKALGTMSLINVSGPAGFNDWNVSYSYASPSTVGSVASFVAPVNTVSNSEYWKVTAPTGGQSQVTINLDGSSDVGNSITNLNNLRVVGWNSTTSKWEIVGASATVTGTNVNGTVTTTAPVNFGSYTYFTLASTAPLSASSASFTSPATVSLCSGNSTTMSVAFSGTPPWVLSYTAGATPITTPALATSPYNITVSPVANTTYTLTGITANGVPGTITGTTAVTVTVNPMPVVVLSSSAPTNTICEGTSVTFTATAGLTNYKFRVNGVVVQNGVSNIYTTTSLAAGVQSVDVIGTNAGACATTSSAIAITVNPLPVVGGVISGAASVCKGSTSTYTVPVIANATSYTWTLSNGATGSSTTNSINVTFPNSGNTTISVKGTNGCGSSITASSITVAVNNNAATGAAGAIIGVAQICKGATGYAYSVGAITNATSYIWNYSGSGAAINGTGSSVTIDFAAGASNGNVTVSGTNGCSTGTVSPAYAVTVNTPPTAAIAPASPSVCSGSSIVLTATPAGGSGIYSSHAWSGTGTSSLSATNITNPSFANATGGSYDLTYTVTDSKGCTGIATTTVANSPKPVAEAGNDATGLCTGTAPIQLTTASAIGSYTGTPTWSGSGGTWTQNPDPALATFTPSTPSGSTIATLTLTGTNGCANATDTRTISWSKIPDQPGGITTSSSLVCKGSTVTYSVPNDPIATSYIWTYDGLNATINGTGNSVTIDFASNATSGTLRVKAQNSCGTSALSSDIAITANANPSIPILNTVSMCAGNATTLGITNGQADYTYLWSVTTPKVNLTNPTASSPILTADTNDSMFPVGNATTEIYPDVKVVVTDANGCTNSVVNSSGSKKITIHRIPRTGPPYHIGNNVSK